MNVFDDVTLNWKDVPHVIPANRVLGAIARIEEVLTLDELIAYQARGTAPLAKIAQAFGAALRYAGGRATDDEVYASLFSGADANEKMVLSIATLLHMMVPKDFGKNHAGSLPVGKFHPDATKSSGKRSRRQ